LWEEKNQRQRRRKEDRAICVVAFLTPSSIMLLAMGACPWPRESMEVLTLARGLSQLQQGPSGVNPRRQDKNQWSPAGGSLHNLGRGQREKSQQRRRKKVRQDEPTQCNSLVT